MNILQQAATKAGKSSERIFGDAYSYFEVRISKQFVCDKFKDYMYDGKIPEEPVEAYCLYILAGRVVYDDPPIQYLTWETAR